MLNEKQAGLPLDGGAWSGWISADNASARQVLLPGGRPLRVVHYLPTARPADSAQQFGVLAAALEARGLHISVRTGDGLPVQQNAQPGRLSHLLHEVPDSLRGKVLALQEELQRLRPEVLHCWQEEGNFVGCIAGLLAGIPGILLTAPAVQELSSWYRLFAQSERVHVRAGSSSLASLCRASAGLPARRLHLIADGPESNGAGAEQTADLQLLVYFRMLTPPVVAPPVIAPEFELDETDERSEREPVSAGSSAVKSFVNKPEVPPAFLMPPDESAAPEMTEREAEELAAIQGHFHQFDTLGVHRLARLARGPVVELGSYLGKSTAALLAGAEQSGCRVHAVDPWLPANPAVDGHGHTLLSGTDDFLAFHRHVRARRDRLAVIAARSRDLRWEGEPIGGLFIDAIHTYEEIRADFFHYLPHLRADALVAFHDVLLTDPTFPGVLRFIEEDVLRSGEWAWDYYVGAVLTVRRVSKPTADVAARNTRCLQAARQWIRFLQGETSDLPADLDLLAESGASATRPAHSNWLTHWLTRQRLQGPFLHKPAHGWTAALPGVLAPPDDLSNLYRSRLQLYEDGVRLRPAHSGHDIIQTLGRGRFSHWQGHLLFSTSDNSDPNTNGRAYWCQVPDTPLYSRLTRLLRRIPAAARRMVRSDKQ